MNFSHSIFPRLPLPSSTTYHSSIFQHIPHPYNPDSFESLLFKHDLAPYYPLLPSNLRHSFPLGHMPALTHGVVLPNNPSTHTYMSDIQAYLQKELLAGRMSGPFSCEETELILQGPFQSSPLIVSLQPQQRSMPDKVRICRHLSKASKLHTSVNLHIHKEDFPTHFNLASKVAEIMSFLYLSLFPSIFFSFVTHPFCVLCRGMFSSFLPCAVQDIRTPCALSQISLPCFLAYICMSCQARLAPLYSSISRCCFRTNVHMKHNLVFPPFVHLMMLSSLRPLLHFLHTS